MNQEPLKGAKLTLITIALSAAAFMQILDTSIANVSIPYIAGDLAVSSTIGSWVITMFAVGNAISLPLTGWLAERYGSVKVIVSSILLFTLFSWACAASFSFNMLIFCRFFQGFVAGPLLPLSQSIILLCYPKEKRNFAASLFFLVVVIAPVFGPILGGWITYDYTWPWIFYINIPVGIFATIITWKILKNRESPTVIKKPDIWGFILLFLGVGLLQVMLDKGEQYDWFSSPLICILTILSGICLIFLVIRELSIKEPLVEFTLFKIPTFRIGTILTAFTYMTIFGSIVLTPLWLQEYMGYTALWAGLAVAPMGILPIFLSIPYSKVMNKIRLEYLIFCFFCTNSVSFILSSYMTAQVNVQIVGLVRLLFGLSLIQFMAPFYSFSTRDIPEEKLASATGLFHFLRIFSGGAGTSLCIYLWDRRAILHYQRIGEFLTQFSTRVKDTYSTIIENGIPEPQALNLLSEDLIMQAYVLATNDVFRLCGIISLVMSPIILFSLRRKIDPNRQNKKPVIAD